MIPENPEFYNPIPDPRVNSWDVVKNQSLVVPSTGLDAFSDIGKYYGHPLVHRGLIHDFQNSWPQPRRI